MKSIRPVIGRHGGLTKDGAKEVIGSVDSSFSFVVLHRGVGARKARVPKGAKKLRFALLSNAQPLLHWMVL
jgi:hypothetical protein